MTPAERNALRLQIDASRRARTPHDPGEVVLPALDGKVSVVHGTETAYDKPYNCRCKPCRAAAAAARRRRRHLMTPLKLALWRIANTEAFTEIGDNPGKKELEAELHARMYYALQVVRGEIDP